MGVSNKGWGCFWGQQRGVFTSYEMEFNPLTIRHGAVGKKRSISEQLLWLILEKVSKFHTLLLSLHRKPNNCGRENLNKRGAEGINLVKFLCLTVTISKLLRGLVNQWVFLHDRFRNLWNLIFHSFFWTRKGRNRVHIKGVIHPPIRKRISLR